MEKPLKFVRLLSLKEIAVRRVSVLLCSNSDFAEFFCRFIASFLSSTAIKERLEEIEEKMLELELPEPLRELIIDYVPALGFMIRRWFDMQITYFPFSEDDMKLINPWKLCWTAAGAIDYKKTAEQIVSCNQLCVELRYRIACFYCLENYIPLLWEDLLEYEEELCREPQMRGDLEFCWRHIQKGEQSQLDYLWKTSSRNLTSFNQWAFEESARKCNQAASEYFFQRLTPEEREASLVRAVQSVLEDREQTFFGPSKRPSDVLCYLLSLMTPEQQMGIVRARPDDVLLCFLDWEQQELFSENAGLIWTYIPPSRYNNLLLSMARISEKKDRYVPKLLRELLKHCPLDFKKYLVDLDDWRRPACWRFLFRSFSKNDPEFLREIFSCLDAADKVKLIYTDYVLTFFLQSLRQDQCPVVEVGLREAALSEEDRERLKAVVTRYFGVDGVTRKFFEILDDVNNR